MDEFIHLRSIVKKKGGTDEDIQARIGKARQAFSMPRPIRRFTTLTSKTKLRVFESYVKAVVLYGSETWRLTQSDWSRSCKYSSIRASNLEDLMA